MEHTHRTLKKRKIPTRNYHNINNPFLFHLYPLQASYKEIFYVGEIGTAMLVKVVSNMLACVNIVAMGEVLMLGKFVSYYFNGVLYTLYISLSKTFTKN